MPYGFGLQNVYSGNTSINVINDFGPTVKAMSEGQVASYSRVFLAQKQKLIILLLCRQLQELRTQSLPVLMRQYYGFCVERRPELNLAHGRESNSHYHLHTVHQGISALCYTEAWAFESCLILPTLSFS